MRDDLIFFLVLLALAAPVFAATDPFPNQPGALTPEEIEAATAAMKMKLGKEAPPPLVSSGKRAPEHVMPGYALFAQKPAPYVDQVMVRRQVICNFFRPMSAWQCTNPHDEIRMTTHGIPHAFTHQIVRGAGDRRGVLEAAEFMYSACFNQQFVAIGGTPFKPSADTDFFTAILDEEVSYRILTGPLGNGNSYSLQKTDRKADGCGFQIHHVRIASTGAFLPESYAKVMAEQAERARKEAEAKERADKFAQEARARAEANAALDREQAATGLRSFSKATVANAALSVAVITGMLTLVVPWLLLGTASRWAIAGTTAGFAATSTLLGMASAFYEPHFVLLFGIPMVVAWLMTAGFGIWAIATRSRAVVPGQAGMAASRLALQSALWVAAIGVVALVAAHTTSGWVTMVEMMGAAALVAIPVLAGRSAMRYALAAVEPASARLRGMLATWGYAVAFGVVAGLAVDLLTGGQFMIPASVAYPMVQFVAGLAAGIIVGIICGIQVQKRPQCQA